MRGLVKFRIGQIVYLSIAPDGSRMGCGFPKEFRQAAVDAEPYTTPATIDDPAILDEIEGALERIGYAHAKAVASP